MQDNSIKQENVLDPNDNNHHSSDNATKVFKSIASGCDTDSDDDFKLPTKRMKSSSQRTTRDSADVNSYGAKREATAGDVYGDDSDGRDVCLLSICIWKAFSNTNFLMFFHLYFQSFLKKYLYLYLYFHIKKNRL